MARVVYADAETVSYDHVAIDAVIAVAGALEEAEIDPGSALAILLATEQALATLPPDAGHGALRDWVVPRVRAAANAR